MYCSLTIIKIAFLSEKLQRLMPEKEDITNPFESDSQ